MFGNATKAAAAAAAVVQSLSSCGLCGPWMSQLALMSHPIG